MTHTSLCTVDFPRNNVSSGIHFMGSLSCNEKEWWMNESINDGTVECSGMLTTIVFVADSSDFGYQSFVSYSVLVRLYKNY